MRDGRYPTPGRVPPRDVAETRQRGGGSLEGDGMWAWLLFRISGLVLVFYLVAHIIVISRASRGASASTRCSGRSRSPLFVVLDLALVVAVLYHALNGVRIILMDFGVGIKSHKHVLLRAHGGGGGRLLVVFAVRGLHLHRRSGRRGGGMRAGHRLEARGGHVVLAVPADHRVVLLIGLAIHLIVSTSSTSASSTYATIAERLAGGFFTVVDIILLAAALFHALNGLRMVLMDYWFTSGSGAACSPASSGWWVWPPSSYGIWALWPWIS